MHFKTISWVNSLPTYAGSKTSMSWPQGIKLAQDWGLNFHLSILVKQVLWVTPAHCSRESKEHKREERGACWCAGWQKVPQKGQWGTDNVPSRRRNCNHLQCPVEQGKHSLSRRKRLLDMLGISTLGWRAKQLIFSLRWDRAQETQLASHIMLRWVSG